MSNLSSRTISTPSFPMATNFLQYFELQSESCFNSLYFLLPASHSSGLPSALRSLMDNKVYKKKSFFLLFFSSLFYLLWLCSVHSTHFLWDAPRENCVSLFPPYKRSKQTTSAFSSFSLSISVRFQVVAVCLPSFLSKADTGSLWKRNKIFGNFR